MLLGSRLIRRPQYKLDPEAHKHYWRLGPIYISNTHTTQQSNLYSLQMKLYIIKHSGANTLILQKIRTAEDALQTRTHCSEPPHAHRRYLPITKT